MKNAFTLAEVLITLGIMGVIAVMTIPTAIHKHQRLVLKNQFKTAYSLVNEAVERMSIDNPDIMNTYCGTSIQNASNEHRYKFTQDFSKYFNTAKLYTVDNYFSKENIVNKQPNYKMFNKLPDSNGYNDGMFILSNGIIIFNGYCWIGASNKKGQHVEFLVDINGKKGPNALGYDLFYFWIDPDNKVVTCPQIPNNKNYCNFLTADTTGAHNGVNCSTFALKDEFPHDSSKTYWENLP